MHCTHCGAEVEGRFCGACGATVLRIPCPGCGREAEPGARYCTGCGSRLSAAAPAEDAPARGGTGDGAADGPGRAASGPGDPGGAVGWWISGALLVALLVVVGVTALGGAGGDEPPGPQPGALGPAPGVDLSAMTPREAADRLFNRVMEALSARDSAEVVNFLPMALDAYEIARPLDEDGLFHLSLLQRAAGEFRRARATAEEALERNPDHLLALSSAADASLELDDLEAARAYYERLLDAWEREMAEERPEYREHAPLLPIVRREAGEFLEGTGS